MKFAVKNCEGELEPIIGHTENAWIVLANGRSEIRLFGQECCAVSGERWEKLVVKHSAV